MRRLFAIGALATVATISALAVVLQHRPSSPRCALDGIRIDSRYEVSIILKDETVRRFSCIRSAQIWLIGNSEPVSSVWVTDELTKDKIRAHLGYYVESPVITTPHTGNKTHVFAHLKAAKMHAQLYRGKFVKNPFGHRQQTPVKWVRYAPDVPERPGLILPSIQKSLCLPSHFTLLYSPTHGGISKKHVSRLCSGYSSPPEKPPKRFS